MQALLQRIVEDSVGWKLVYFSQINPWTKYKWYENKRYKHCFASTVGHHGCNSTKTIAQEMWTVRFLCGTKVLFNCKINRERMKNTAEGRLSNSEESCMQWKGWCKDFSLRSNWIKGIEESAQEKCPKLLFFVLSELRIS